MLKKLQALKAKKGFTLVELIVVIAIIGVLAAILIPTLSGVIESSRKRGVESTCSSIHSLAATYASQYFAKTGNNLETANLTTAKVDMDTDDSGTEITFDAYIKQQIPELNTPGKGGSYVAEFTDGKPSKVVYTFGKYKAEWNTNDGQKSATKT